MATAAGAKQVNGVLAVSAIQTSGNASKVSPPKPQPSRLKVVVRRLAPGLTEGEFTKTLGDDWKAGNGNVDWFSYEAGKDSKNPSKPSRPARAYLHLTAEAHLMALSDNVRQCVFEDAQNTFKDSSLIGPPTVEFATYNRIPQRPRVDARAGTIDSDPEFMAFLESLANPTSGKEANGESGAEILSGKGEKVTTTPLVQYLRDKKASKNKEAAAKAAKKHESRSDKIKAAKESTATPEDPKKKASAKTIEKASKEAVKILSKGPAPRVSAGSSTAAEPSSDSATATPKLDVTKVPGRQRSAVVAAHIRMLQRDLGLSPAQAHRQVRRDTADAQKAERAAAAEKASTGATPSESSVSQAPQAPAISTAPKAGPTANSRRSRAKGSSSTEAVVNKLGPLNTPTAPMVLLKKPDTGAAPQQTSTAPAATPARPTPSVAARKPAPVAVPSDGATQAFVKHANPSQGVTELLLKEALEKFGAVSKVEIDKRKGFAYVDFADSDGLKKAMAANPTSVAQGTIQVMQRKGTTLPPDKKAPHQAPHAPSRGGRGGRGGTVGRRGGRGGGRGGAAGAQGGAAEASKAPASAPTGPAT